MWFLYDITLVLTLELRFRLLVPIVAISTGKANNSVTCQKPLISLVFSCSDEALAVWMLKQTNDFKGASLIRTRDPAKLAECSVVVDVGGVYDPAQQRYDHHQVIIKQKVRACIN